MRLVVEKHNISIIYHLETEKKTHEREIISNIIIIVVVIMGLYGVGAPFGLSLDTPLSIRYGVYVNVYLIV